MISIRHYWMRIQDDSLNLTYLSRYARAERDLKQARPYGVGATQFFAVAEIEPPKEDAKELLVAMTSDRGNGCR